jgi:3-methyladenine DNA glycosylase AlkD
VRKYGGAGTALTAVALLATIRGDLNSLKDFTTPSVRSVRRQYSRLLVDQPGSEVIAIAQSLLTTGSWMERVVAYELIENHPGALDRLNNSLVDQLGEGLADWGSIDLFGVTIAGVAWRAERVSDAQVMKWARSKDRWRRRLALVATVPLNAKSRGGAGDAARTLTVCRALAYDRDDMVVKALSWALRELAKRDPASVRRFLEEENERLASRVKREVTTKLETGLKRRSAR